MLVTFEEYKSHGGRCITSQKDFERMEPMVESLIDSYIKTKIPYWRVLPLEEYGLDLMLPITQQLDFIESHGGTDYFLGNSDLGLTSVSTSGFSYSLDTSAKMPALYNLPIMPLAKIEIDYQLNKAGLSCMVLL